MVILDQGVRRHSNKVKGKRPAMQSMVQAEGRRRVTRGFLLLITYCQGGIDNVELFLRLLEPQLSLPRAELPWRQVSDDIVLNHGGHNIVRRVGAFRFTGEPDTCKPSCLLLDTLGSSMPILFCVCHSRYSNRPLGDGVWLLKTSQRRWCMAVEDEPTWLTSSGSAVCELQRQVSVKSCYFLKDAPLHQHPAHARLGVCAEQGYCFMFRLPNCGNLWLCRRQLVAAFSAHPTQA